RGAALLGRRPIYTIEFCRADFSPSGPVCTIMAESYGTPTGIHLRRIHRRTRTPDRASAGFDQRIEPGVAQLAAQRRKVVERRPVPRPPRHHERHLREGVAGRRREPTRSTGAAEEFHTTFRMVHALLHRLRGTSTETETSGTQEDRSAIAAHQRDTRRFRGGAKSLGGVPAPVGRHRPRRPARARPPVPDAPHRRY